MASPIQAEIGLRLPPPRTVLVPLGVADKEYPFQFINNSLYLTNTFPYSFSRSLAIDSSGQFMTLVQRLSTLDILMPRFMTVEDFVSEKLSFDLRRQWTRSVTSLLSSSLTQGQTGRGLTIETPKIKSEAFRRVFGGETLSLNVNGNITIDGTMRNEKRSQVKTATDRAPNTNFQMKQTQRFTVEGKIGENVSVLVDQDSERPFDFENAIKLQYASDEDGIIRKIEAGNVALSLPSTRFVTFSAQNSGLFGIKTQMKLGGLDVTAIASMEKGQKKKLTLTGGKEQETLKVQDYEYKKATYFFLDQGFQKRYPNLDDLGRHLIRADSILSEIEVYKSDNNYEIKSGAIRAWAVVDPNQTDTTFTSLENYRGYFLRLEPITDYYVKPELGYIVMNMPLQESEILAVAYRDTSGRITGTMLANRTDTSATPIFKIIKPRTPRHTDQTWNLQWKNVYSLGSRNIDLDGFELKLYYKTPSGDPQESITVNGAATGFLHVFGLDNINANGDRVPDNVIDDDSNVLSRSRGELIFPNLRPFDPDSSTDTRFPFPQEMSALRNPAIYDTTSDNYIRQQSKFYIDIKSSRRSPTYSLGMNVIEGTEEVLLNNTKLQKDIDYTIDYFSGTLTMLNENAMSPTANLEINYESQQMMAIDKKSLMGVRAEYSLWESGSNRSFLGATLLYLNQKTLDQRIRVGQDGPMNNLVWDINSALYFQPNFITKALDALPFLRASSPSSIALEGEFAQVIPNPNTLNNESTGDRDGVAYLDDFEGAKRQVSLGVIRNGWLLSSIPSSSDSVAVFLGRKGRLYWYNPYSQVAIQEIWPDREVTTNFGGSTVTHVLTMDFTPNSSISHPLLSWAGIQKALSAGYADQTDSRFLEVWVQGDYGRLHIDLGQISEDAIPNFERDTEDKIPAGGVRNEILDDDEDTGIDGIYGSDPPSLFYPHESATVSSGRATPYDFWDLNRDGTKEENEPWSYDNWDYESRSSDYRQTNGTEGNKSDGSIIYPDTEDLNRNGDVDLNNDYFEYTFSLEKNHPDTVFIDGGKGNTYGWRLYRIPMDNPSRVVGSPDWSRIEFVRVWIDSVIQETALSIAEINLAGNEWKLRGVNTPPDTTYNTNDDSTMTITVMNTHDNPEYESPPGVEGVIDPIQKIRAKEQSLVIKLQNLAPGASAIAQKEFYQAQNLIYYKHMKMFVHGGDALANLADSTAEFFLRWGSDTENKHYYEVSIPVYPGWSEKNNIDVDFEDLSRLKVQMETLSTDTISETQSNGHVLSVIGKPSLTNIRYLIVGVRNMTNGVFSGELWLDELRISGIRKEKGIALRARADIRLSDVMTINGEYNRKDADFHTVNERFGGGSNTQSGTLNASLQLQNFLPASWGVSLPLTASYSRNQETPKYLPGSDILVTKETVPPDLLQKIRTEIENKGLTFSFSKRTKSRNFFSRYLIDPIQGRFGYSENDRSDSKTRYSKNLGYVGMFSYSLNFGNQYYWEPFKWLGKTGFLKNIAQTKFYYLPTKLDFKIDGNESLRKSETSGGVVSNVNTSNFTQNFSTSLRPFQSFSIDYALTNTSDMRFSKWIDMLSSFSPGDPLSTNQQINTSLTPKIVTWFTPSFKYTSTYQWADNPQERNKGTSQSTGVNANLSISGSFDPQKLIKSFQKKPAPKTPRVRQPVTQGKPQPKTPEQGQPVKPETDKTQKKPFPVLTFLSFLGKSFQKIDPISINVSQNQSANHFGILGRPSFAYQLGTSLDPGVPISPNLTSDRTSIKNDWRFSIKSGLKISSKLTATFDYNYSTSKTRTTQTTGNVTQSSLLIKDKSIPFPNWSIQWRGLEKLPIISRFIKTFSLSHSFSGKNTKTWNGSENAVSQVSLSKDFRPLLGMSLTFSNGMTANGQYNTGVTYQEQKRYSQGKTKTTATDLAFTMSYSKKGGFRIPFFKKKKLDNAIDFSLTLSKKLNATAQSRDASGSYSETAHTDNWSLKPLVSYSFTKTMRGGMNFEIGERKDLRVGKTKFTAFGINATITLAGN